MFTFQTSLIHPTLQSHYPKLELQQANNRIEQKTRVNKSRDFLPGVKATNTFKEEWVLWEEKIFDNNSNYFATDNLLSWHLLQEKLCFSSVLRCIFASESFWVLQDISRECDEGKMNRWRWCPSKIGRWFFRRGVIRGDADHCTRVRFHEFLSGLEN